MSFYDTLSNNITINELEKWNHQLYKKLGWITYAHENGNNDKVVSFIISIKKLILSINDRLKIIKNDDIRLDLNYLLHKVKHLYKISNELFNSKKICIKCNNSMILQDGGSKSKKKYRSKISKFNLDYKKLSNNSSKKSSKKSSKRSLNNFINKKESFIKKLSNNSSNKTSKRSLKNLINKKESFIKKLSNNSSKK